MVFLTMSTYLCPSECLAKLPVTGRCIIGSNGSAIAGSDFKGEALAVEVTVALPILAPVAGHCLPAGPGALYRNRVDVTCSSHVSDEYEIEVRVPVHGEPNSARSVAGYPLVHYGDDARPVLCDLLENRLGEIEMLERRIAPTASIVG